MSKITIGVVMVFHNELNLIKEWLPKVQEYADEIVCGNHASTDGSKEFLVEKGVKVIDFDFSCLIKNGFSYMKNECNKLLTTDWIHSLDADEILDKHSRENIHNTLKKVGQDSIQITTRTYHRTIEPIDMSWDTIVKRVSSFNDDYHRRIFKQGSGIEWKGYIHEELFKNNMNCVSTSWQNSPFIHRHFSHFKQEEPNAYKENLYTYMLLNAYYNQPLQEFTNRWWYDIYVPQKMTDCSREWMEEAYKYLINHKDEQ